MDLGETDVRAVLAASPDAILIVDQDGRIQFASDRIDAFGFSPHELLGLPIESLLPEWARSRHVSERATYFASPQPRPMGVERDLHGLHKQGYELPVDVSLAPVQFASGLHVICAVRDITERKRVEAERERAVQSGALKSLLLAAAGHDLRQPLQAAEMYLTVLGRRVEDPELKVLIEKICTAHDAMTGILDALLDVAKLGNGALHVQLRDFDANEMLLRVVASNHPQAIAKGLNLSCGEIERAVHSDPLLLERVIANFVSNAIRYTERGDIKISCTYSDDTARISVSDTGIGIPSDALNDIFENRVQLNNPERNPLKGLGFGLAIVRYIAEALHHRIDVKSTIGGGSTFTIEVPLATSRSSDAPT